MTASRAEHVCATCRDLVEHATIVALDGANAEVQFESGARSQIATDVTPGVRLGDVVLVHQGIAISVAPASRRAT